MDTLPELGVGMIYSSAIEPLLERYPDAVDVLEIEPQTTWIETNDPSKPYLVRSEVLDHIARLPGHKLVHSVGTPVGGSVQALAAQAPLLRQTVEVLGCPWASEHLSFNLTPDFFTGFFLPPRQTEEGVEIYADAIRDLGNRLGVPFAFETGVNYLRPRADEIRDGDFVAQVAHRADCGILLDLHNIYCNSLNGRQKVEDFLAEIPLDRVWEVHLAGGFEMDGFWLDAHSGSIPPPLEEICREVIPQLPNLKAIVYELFSSFVPHFGLEAAHGELSKLRELWELRRPMACRANEVPEVRAARGSAIDPSTWEKALGRVVIGRPASSPLEDELTRDPGTALIRDLVKEFRASMVVSVYRFTSRLLMLALTPGVFRAFLEDFWSKTAPRQYAGSEGDAFADYLEELDLGVPQLRSILAYERATLATLRDGQSRVVRFDVEPLTMLKALDEGILLRDPEPGDFEIEIVGDSATGAKANGSEERAAGISLIPAGRGVRRGSRR